MSKTMRKKIAATLAGCIVATQMPYTMNTNLLANDIEVSSVGEASTGEAASESSESGSTESSEDSSDASEYTSEDSDTSSESDSTSDEDSQTGNASSEEDNAQEDSSNEEAGSLENGSEEDNQVEESTENEDVTENNSNIEIDGAVSDSGETAEESTDQTTNQVEENEENGTIDNENQNESINGDLFEAEETTDVVEENVDMIVPEQIKEVMPVAEEAVVIEAANSLFEGYNVASLEDGTYTVPITILKTTSNDASMANKCVEQEAKLVVENGVGRIYLTFKSMTMGSIAGYLTNGYYFESQEDYEACERGDVDTSILKEMTVESKMSSKDYPEVVSFELPELNEQIFISMDIDAGAFKHTYTHARLIIDYDEAEKVEETEEEAFLEDGTYSVPVSILKTTSDADSMANKCLEPEAKLVVEDGKGKVYLTLKPMTMGGITGYLTKGYYFESKEDYEACENGTADVSILKAMTVESTKTENGVTYPEVVSFELPALGEDIYISMDIDAGVFKHDYTHARLVIDYSGAVGEEEAVTPENPSVPEEDASENAPVLSFEDGVYEIGASLLKAASNEASMAANSLKDTARLEVVDGKAKVTLTFRAMDMYGLRGHLTDVWYFNSKADFENASSDASLKHAMTVENTYTEDGIEYPQDVSFYLPSEDEIVYISVFVDMMGMTAEARLKLDLSSVPHGMKQVDEATGITITASSSALDSNAVLEVQTVTEGELFEKVEEKVSSTLKSYVMYNINALVGGNSVQPNGMITISMPIPSTMNASKVELYLVKEDGTLEKVEGTVTTASARAASSSYVFQTSTLGSYILGEKVSTTSGSTATKDLEDGVYDVKISMLKAGSSSSLSMANDALEKTAQIEMNNGVGTIYIRTKPMIVGNITASLQTLKYEDSNGNFKLADVTTKSLDGNPTGFSFELPHFDDYVNVKVNPQVAIMGNTDIDATLYIDYSTMKESTSGVQSGTETLADGIYTIKGNVKVNDSTYDVLENALKTEGIVEVVDGKAVLYLESSYVLCENALESVTAVAYKKNGNYTNAVVEKESLLGDPHVLSMDISNYADNYSLKLTHTIEALGTQAVEAVLELDYDSLELTADKEVTLAEGMNLPLGSYAFDYEVVQTGTTIASEYSEAFTGKAELKVTSENIKLILPMTEKSEVKVLQYKNSKNLYDAAVYNEAAGSYEIELDEYVSSLLIKAGKDETSLKNAEMKFDFSTFEVLEVIEEAPEVEITAEKVAYITGYTDGTFRPDQTVTKAEAATMLARLYAVSEDEMENYTSDFKDVSQNAWHSKAVGLLQRLGVVTGYKGSFNPENAITRAEFVAMVSRFSGVSETEVSSAFNDIEENHWAANYIAVAQNQGWLTGYNDGSFKPDQKITRAEAVKVINAVAGRIVDKEAIDALEESVFSDVAKDHWAYYEIMEAVTY